MLKILVVGPGLIGKKHNELVDKNPDCCVEAVVSLNPQLHVNMPYVYGAPVYENIELALQKHKFDAAIISTPNELHKEHALRCINAKLPLLIEKPLADTLQNARQIVSSAYQNNTKVLVGHHRTHGEFINKAEAFIKSEHFGRLVSIQGSAQFYKPSDYFSAGPWRTREGGGPLLINMIHEIGIMRQLCGEIKKVFAFASNAVRGFEVEDTVSINLVFENGCLGSFLLSDCAASTKSWEMTSGENSVYPHYPNEACYHIAGTRASLDFPNMCVKSYDSDLDASWLSAFKESTISVDKKDPLESQLNHFVKVVKGEIEPLVSAESGFKNMQILDAIKHSIQLNRPIELNTQRIKLENRLIA